jgi:hypothetical protein
MPKSEMTYKKKSSSRSAFFTLRASIALLVCGAAVCSMFDRAKSPNE